jgi:outer membrane protein assembly factor BamB
MTDIGIHSQPLERTSRLCLTPIRPLGFLPAIGCLFFSIVSACGTTRSFKTAGTGRLEFPGALIQGREGYFIQEYTKSSKNLSRVDLEDWERLWTADAIGQLDGSCAYRDVLVTASGGLVVGLDPAFGARRWSVEVKELGRNTAPILTCPDEGRAVYIIGGEKLEVLVAIEKATGKVLWRAASDGYRFVAAADGELVFVERGSGAPELLEALNTETGARRWRIPRQGGDDRVMVQSGIPYVIAGAWMAAVSRETGLNSWTMSLGDGAMSAQFEEGALYVTSAHKVARLNLENGTPKWEHIASRGLTHVSLSGSAPIVLTLLSPDKDEILSADDGHVIASSPGNAQYLKDKQGGLFRLSLNQKIARLDPVSFKEMWSSSIEVFGGLVTADARNLYIALLRVGPQTSTTVVAINRETGKVMRREDLGGAASFIAEDSARLYFTVISPADGTTSVAIKK